MKDIHEVVADVEARWQAATPEERRDLVTKLRGAEGASTELDDVTRSRIARLIHTIQAAEHSHDKEYLTPPSSQGTGFSFGQTLPSRFDTPDR